MDQDQTLTYLTFGFITRERARQQLLHPGKTLDIPTMPDEQRITIMIEEIGEVARAMQDGDREQVFNEVVQVATLSVAWLESFLQEK